MSSHYRLRTLLTDLTFFRAASCAALMLGTGAGSSLAQGVQTSMIEGVVRDAQALAVPGVSVSAASPALQGLRTSLTDQRGFYSIAALPGGEYVLTFDLPGFATVTRRVVVPFAVTVERNAVLDVANVAEQAEVVGSYPPTLSNQALAANLTHPQVEALPAPRTLEGIAQLSPGLTENAPGRNQVVVNGAFAFDNVFMINGVDIGDNLRAQPQDLFVEDAIQETQVLTSGIPAEYGRFTGGVINAITRSGGNTVSGTFRVNFSNPAWIAKTPIETADHLDKLQEVYEATAGGPLRRDRLWFFASGRAQNTDSSNTLPVTLLPYTQTTKNMRGEIKLTSRLGAGQTFQAGYLNNDTRTTNGSGALSFLVDPHSLDTIPLPNWYTFANYRRILGRDVLAEAQYSERRWSTGGGGRSHDIVDSPFFAATLGPYIFNAPYFDANDQEQRNNRQFTGSMTGSLHKVGRHQIKSGYEFFRSQRSGGGSQSSTGYVFDSDFALDANGTPLLDSTGHLIPLFVPGVSGVDFIPAARGAVMDVDTQSLYVQDHWIVNGHWLLDLGARYEHVKAVSTGNIIGVDNFRTVPRLGVAYDPTGRGRQAVKATYGAYSGRYNEAQIGANSPVVNAPDLFSVYQGPAGQGRDFAAGFDLANYPITPDNSFVAKPPASNVSMAPNLKSPLVREVTASYSRALGGRGSADATYVFRRTTDAIEDFQTLANGFTDITLQGIEAGLATNRVYANTDLANRRYQGLVFQSTYRFSSRWDVNGHYTVQLQNDGNYEGETAAAPGATSLIGNYPEAFSAARFYPEGRLQDFQRHRLRMWSSYDVALGRLGDALLSGLWRVDSARVYSLTANVPLTSTQASILTAAGYPDAPTPNTVFFGDRGSQEFKGYGLVDAAVTYNIGLLGSRRPWVKLTVFNVLNNQKLISWNTTVKPDPTSPADALGLPTGYVTGPLFGRATSTSNFPAPFNGQSGGRTFLVAAGVRF